MILPEPVFPRLCVTAATRLARQDCACWWNLGQIQLQQRVRGSQVSKMFGWAEARRVKVEDESMVNVRYLII